MKLNKEELKDLISDIEDLYQIPGCYVGGPLHCLLDDQNVSKHFVNDSREKLEEWCVRMLDESEAVNQDGIINLSLKIQEQMRRLTLAERYYLLCHVVRYQRQRGFDLDEELDEWIEDDKATGDKDERGE